MQSTLTGTIGKTENAKRVLNELLCIFCFAHDNLIQKLTETCKENKVHIFFIVSSFLNIEFVFTNVTSIFYV